MAQATKRTQSCDPADARRRLQQAQAMIMVAEIVEGDTSDIALPSVSAALSVLAGIAAVDAACCAALRERSRGQSHMDAVRTVRPVVPHGDLLAKKLGVLVSAKDDSHYGLVLVSEKKARSLLRTARDLVALAVEVVDTHA